MPIERRPANNLPPHYVPSGGTPYRVRTNETWESVAAAHGLSAHDLIHFNFGTTYPPEVNWYLRQNVGCVRATHDQKNWMFTSDASPGIIYLPPKAGWKRSVPPTPTPTPSATEQQHVSGLWFGLGGQTGGHLAIAGKETLEALLYSYDNYHNTFWLNVDGYRIGPGLGGSIGLVGVVATGAPSPGSLQGLKVTDVDFQANMAGKWGDLAKGIKELNAVRKFAKAAKFVDKTISFLEWEKLRDAVTAAIRAGKIRTDEKDVHVLPIPGAGIGLELSLYYSWGYVIVHGQSIAAPGSG